MRLIPAIDLKGGHCVRLLKGISRPKRATTRTRVSCLPSTASSAPTGCTWSTSTARATAAAGNRAIIAGLAGQSAVKLQVGGGLRNSTAVAQMLDLGIARVVVGSAALIKADQVRSWLDYFGPERIALAFDVRLDEAGVPCVATHGWRQQSQLSLWDAAASFANFELKHVLCTDVSRDGALSGPNVELYTEAVRRFPQVAWQASGGIRDARDLRALAECGAAAAISGKALLEELIPLEELRPFLPNA